MKLFDVKGNKVLVDAEYLPLVAGYSWYITKIRKKIYISTAIGGKTKYLHRLDMGEPRGYEIDHINGDSLDNRLANLRTVTRKQNCMNSGFRNKYKGAHFYKATGTWMSYITIGGKKKHLGYFKTEREAAKQYNKEATQVFGEFARLNDV